MRSDGGHFLRGVPFRLNMGKRRGYIFTDKKGSNRAWMAVILGIISLVSLGIVEGSGGLLRPKDNITREQMAAILYRYCVSKGIDVANYGDLSRFPDGDKVSDYAVEAMRWAVDRGLIAGMDDGRLDPAGTATRAQVATILNRFCEMIGA